MAFVSINGVGLPAPSEFQVSIMDISKANRNAKGSMIIERIATKHKLAFTYTYITRTDLDFILNLIAPTFYNVSYLNPQTNKTRTASFYCGDRDVGMIDYINGVARYRDFTFNLIER